MAIGGSDTPGRTSRSFLAVVLVATAVVLAAAVWAVAGAAARQSEPATRAYLIRLTWLASVLLTVVLVVLAMMAARRIIFGIRPRKRPEPTSRISAWEEAGKRFKLEDEDYSED